MLNAEIIEPKQTATAAVIWLHGIGADGHDFVPIVPHLKLKQQAQIRFIFPHAPIRPVTSFGGEQTRAWYDILELTEIRKINEQHLMAISQDVGHLIEQQIDQGIDAQRIILIGFSQGGAVALHTALHFPKALAGLIALSTYLGINKLDENQLSPANRNIAIKMAHGHQDMTVTENNARLAYDTLKKLGYEIEWNSYTMAHEVCLTEIRDIGRWIEGFLSD